MHKTQEDRRKSDTPPTIGKSNPDPEFEEKLRSHPEDSDTKVDVGSDESMDASDPSSAVQPAHEEPAPSSSSPDERDQR